MLNLSLQGRLHSRLVLGRRNIPFHTAAEVSLQLEACLGPLVFVRLSQLKKAKQEIASSRNAPRGSAFNAAAIDIAAAIPPEVSAIGYPTR